MKVTQLHLSRVVFCVDKEASGSAPLMVLLVVLASSSLLVSLTQSQSAGSHRPAVLFKDRFQIALSGCWVTAAALPTAEGLMSVVWWRAFVVSGREQLSATLFFDVALVGSADADTTPPVGQWSHFTSVTF